MGADLAANGKLNSALSYSLSVSPYWNEIDAGRIASSFGKRSTFSASGRANLNWQARAGDVLQLNIQATGARLQAQGVVAPSSTLNEGWRHNITDRVTATITAQDLLNTNRFRRDLETPSLVENLRVLPVSRAVLLRRDYRFGGGASKAKTTDFDYGTGGER